MPFFSQSPCRVGSGPALPPISFCRASSVDFLRRASASASARKAASGNCGLGEVSAFVMRATIFYGHWRVPTYQLFARIEKTGEFAGVSNEPLSYCSVDGVSDGSVHRDRLSDRRPDG